MITKRDSNKERKKRHKRVRAKVNGTTERPRLNVYRSTAHIYAQVIDDVKGHTLASSSTLDKKLKAKLKGKTKKEQAKIVGLDVAQKAMAKKVTTVVFDRGGYLYTGRVKDLADGAREGGLIF
ncbi:MAG: 50S ribosomal protein L18 [Firmicutes bacterium]|nr:50S ribosomal protein L18 [Bacillota bacterium]